MTSQFDLTRFYDIIIRNSVFQLGFLTREFQISFYTINSTSSTGFFIFYWNFLELKILRIYWSSHWKCSGEKVFLEIVVAIFKKFLKITVAMWICGQKTWKISVKKISFSTFSGFQRVTCLKMNYFTSIV